MAVIVVGSLNVDVTARLDEMPAVGETRLAREGWVGPGGKGANQAVAARLMGARTRMVGMTGSDALAGVALAQLKAVGVDVGDVRAGARATGMALIMVDGLANSTIAVVAGANGELDAARIEAARAPGPEDTVLVSLEIPMETAVAAAHWARSARARLLVDPAPAPDRLPPALWRADALMPNRSEAERILGVRIRDVRDAKAAARALLDGGARIGIVKLGGDGLVWAAKSGVFYLPAFEVEAVDTTGAGDVFAGGLAAALDRGAGWSEAIREAAAAAALACTRPGTQTAAPTLEAVRRTGWL